MRSTRRNRRGLAEIVGTLMLVVIVVAAATAFSFFVAAYQKQLQAEEALNHDKALEDVRILGLSPTPEPDDPDVLASVNVQIASLDVNAITIDGITLNGYPVEYFGLDNLSGVSWPNGCFNSPLEPAPITSCVLDLPGETEIGLVLNLESGSPGSLTSPPYFYGLSPNPPSPFSVTSLLSFQVFTSLGNQFTQSFVPPVALAGVTFIDSYPVLDGTNSYQPSANSTTAVTIDQWLWSVHTPPGSVVEGLNAETGILLFSVPSAYTPSNPAVYGLVFDGAAAGSPDGTNPTVVSIDRATPTLAIVTFTYTYQASSAGALYLMGGTLVDNLSSLVPESSQPINGTGAYSGQEVELGEPFTLGIQYYIQLTVSDSEFLVGTTTITYTFT